MGEIDEASAAIGSLKSDVGNLRQIMLEQHAVILDNIKNIAVDMKERDREIAINKRIAEKANRRLDDILHPDDGILTIAANQAAHLTETSKKAMWLGTGLVGSSLFAGTAFGGWLQRVNEFFGGGGQ